MANLVFKNINKIYDNNVQAVFDFNLEIKDKEFIVFVGPSGCGKSTTLRMVAGLEEISTGELYIDDRLVNEVEPKDRDIAMVFQSYALYPHMTVRENMGFALKLKHVSKEEINKKVESAAEILGLTKYLERKPKALSGGQRQRVALGRAIVRNPKVFLMDEPLSNLDAKLRVQMRSEITRIHQAVGTTTIYVTHDQTEAMTMADRIVVMKDGHIQQIGTPKEIYNNPANTFVASFIGSPAMNFISGYFDGEKFVTNEYKGEKVVISLDKDRVKTLKEYANKMIPQLQDELQETKESIEEVKAELEKLHANRGKKKIIKQYEDGLKILEKEIENIHEKTKAYVECNYPIVLGVRPEHIYFKGDEVNSNPSQDIFVTCEISELLGSELIIYGSINGQQLVVKTSAKNEVKNGETSSYQFDMNEVHIFDAKTTNVIK